MKKFPGLEVCKQQGKKKEKLSYLSKVKLCDLSINSRVWLIQDTVLCIAILSGRSTVLPLAFTVLWPLLFYMGKKKKKILYMRMLSRLESVLKA